MKESFLYKEYIKYKSIIHYLITGGLTTLFNICFYIIMRDIFNIDYMINTVIDWILTVLLAFYLNKLFVFYSDKKGKDFFKEIFEFFKYRIVTLFLEIGSMYLLVDMIRINDIISKIFVNIIVIILNYVFSKLFVFKES